MARSLIKYLLRFALAGMLLAVMLMFAAPQWLSKKTGIPLWSEHTQINPLAAPKNYADLIADTMPSVVRIYKQTINTTADLAFLQDPHYATLLDGQLLEKVGSEIGLGSGVIASHDGHIITNHHVIADADRILVSLSDGRTAEATLVGMDPATDLAVIKIELDKLTPAKVPTNLSSRVGDLVFAIGNPHGLGQSVSMGIISGQNLNRLGLNTFESFIQTDAAINQGNSGGALINTRGELVGINTAHFYNSATSERSQGIGLAIPISIASNVLHSIVEQGTVVRGWLGIDFHVSKRQFDQDVFSPQAEAGILLSGVYANSPAHTAGLQAGDLITYFDGRQVTNWNESLAYVTDLTPGSALEITYRRDKITKATTAILGTRPASK